MMNAEKLLMRNGCRPLGKRAGMSEQKPREWFINPIVGYKCEVNESGIGLTGNEVHVIEYSAYEQALKAVAKERKEGRGE